MTCMKDDLRDNEFDGLIDAFKKLDKPLLDDQAKLRVKNSLMSRLDAPLAFDIRRLVADTFLSISRKILIKENIFSTIENRFQRRFFWSHFFAFASRATALVLVLAVSFGVFSFWNMDVGVVRAATFTSLESFDGQVKVLRGDDFVVPTAGMEIFVNDKILTGYDGSAVVAYFDNSLSRLDHDTEVVVNQLKDSDEEDTSTYVEVSVLVGKVWSRVVNLVEADASFVVEANDVYTAVKRGAFNISVDDEKLEIDVFNHAVDVKTSEGVSQVVSGNKVVVDADSGKIESARGLQEDEKNDKWIVDNIESDKQYLGDVEKRLIVAQMEASGFENDNDISFGKSFTESTLLFFTFDDVKKRKLELDIAEKDFVAALLTLNSADVTGEQETKAIEVIQSFASQVRAFYAFVDQIALTDEAYAQELRDYVKRKILLQKRDLIVFLPDSPLYFAKGVIDQLELFGAIDDSELVAINVAQATTKLAVAEDIKDRGDEDLAVQVVAESTSQITGAIEIIDAISESGDVSVADIDDAVDSVVDNIGLIQALDVVPVGQINELVNNVAEVTGVTEIVVTPPPVSVSDIPTVPDVISRDEFAANAGEVNNNEPETVTEGPFGVRVKGDKVLPPSF